MAQFDVFRNPGRHRNTTPFVVVLQSARFDRGATRCVAPLVFRSEAATEEHDLAPRFTIAGQEVVMDNFNLATLFAKRLGGPIASLAGDAARSKLTGALDERVCPA
jgi:toxin CcdB